MKLKNKDVLGIKLTAGEIESILDTASDMKKIVQSPSKKAHYLRGKSVVTLFYENSTRTRVSFELAGKYMSADTVNVTAAGSSVQKGESLLDTGRTLDAMGTDIIVIRHSMAGAPHLLAKHVKASVINAGDGMHEHPTQALLDMFTIRERFGGFKGLKVAIIGDIYHSRVARSNIIGLCKMGAEPVVYGPATLIPVDFEKIGAVIAPTLTMPLRCGCCHSVRYSETEKALFPSQAEYAKFFGVNYENIEFAGKMFYYASGPVQGC